MSDVRRRCQHVGLCLMSVVAGTVGVARAQVPFERLHGFPLPASPYPNALVQATDGNFYGTTAYGGASGVGTAFKMTPSGTVTILHDFRDSPDGAYPYRALIQAIDGNFYGTTVWGGSEGQGTVFKLTPTGDVTVLHSFSCAVDGCYPEASLIQSADGALYGTASYGGPGWGSLFKITSDGSYAVVHAFSGFDPAGYNPEFCLLQTADGNIYGTTSFGAGWNDGAVFRVAPDGTVAVVHSFNGFYEGLSATSLIPGTDGNLYGTLFDGVSSGPATNGALFKLTLAGELTVLHYFTATDGDGGFPGGLLRAADGNIYGTTRTGGNDNVYFGAGTVFKLTPAGDISTLYTFTGGTDGANPDGPLVQGSDGSLYGTNRGSYGTVFRMTTAGVVTTLANMFPGFEGFTPRAALIEAADGNLYGTTAAGGRYYKGTVFRMTPGGTMTVLHSFTGTDGASPRASLLQGSDGNFYGTTASGGSWDLGTIFRMTPDGAVTVLHSFTGLNEGASPYGGLVRGPDGNFYGTTRDGGALNFGTVFRVTPTGAFASLHQFGGRFDGAQPLAGLVLGFDESFYGTTSSGGSQGAGTTFRITSDGQLMMLHAFSGTDGTSPQAALLLAADNNFYGTTFGGGVSGLGTIFRMTAAGAVTLLHSFAGADGAAPAAPLIQGADGNLYGTTSNSGNGLCVPAGTAFQSTLTGFVTVLYSFRGSEHGPIGCPGNGSGTHPVAALLRARDGNLYGTTSDDLEYSSGGYAEAGGGTVFRLDLIASPTGVHVTRSAGSHVQLSWLAVSNAASYTVKRAVASGQESVIATGLTLTSFVDGSAIKGQRYYYVVTAVNGFGESVASYEVSITAGRATDADFNGDGTSDIAVFRPSTSTWFSAGLSAPVPFGSNGDIPVPGDYDGDGIVDLAVFRPSTGTWYVWQSGSNYGLAIPFGAVGDVPVPADYDGDGLTDIAVYRPASGTWYAWLSATHAGFAIPFGAAGDTPEPADYDGDGKADLAVFRASTATWFIWQSGSNSGLTVPFGATGDIPVPGDYDGDGRTDLAVFRASTATWYVWQSASNSGLTVPFGFTGDIPVPADYDGDGRTDFAVFHPSTGTWYIWQSLTNSLAQSVYGNAADTLIRGPR